jgi:preprotein translocase subunit SecA
LNKHKCAGHNFDIRKRVLEYDDVVNRQREQFTASVKILFDEPDVVKKISGYDRRADT